METLSYWWPRIVATILFGMMLFFRGTAPNPFYALWIRETWLDRLVTQWRLTIPWSVFCGIKPRYRDVEIRVQLADGTTEKWYLLRDCCIGPVGHLAAQTRITMILYFPEWSFWPKRLCELMERGYRTQGRKLAVFEATIQWFDTEAISSTESAHASPLSSELIYRFVSH